VLLPLTLCRGQIVHDPITDADLSSKLSDISGKADAMITAAGNQLAALQKLATDDTVNRVATSVDNLNKTISGLSTIIGDPSKDPQNVNKSGYNRLKDQVQNWIDNGSLGDPPKFDNITAPTSPTDASQVYNATGGNLFTAITGSVKYSAPTQADPKATKTDPRDPTLYVGQQAELAAVAQYYNVRQAALDRRSQLQTLLKDTLDALQNSNDFATLAKQTALAEAVESQLKAVNDDLNTSFDDVAVRSLQIYAMGQVEQSASNEVTQKAMANKTSNFQNVGSQAQSASSTITSSGTSTGTSVGSVGYTTGRLPWKPAKF
jgi:hypothetical protein